MRLQKYLAQCGVAARRKAEDLIVRGKVTVNGKVETRLGCKVDAAKDNVRVGGKRVFPETKVYYLLNKPKGVVTSKKDPHGRRTVMSLLPDDAPSSVAPVGRLDFYTEGVLLLTNDGDLASSLLSPATHVEKTYHVKLKGIVADDDLDPIRFGVRLRDRTKTLPAMADVIKQTGRNTWAVITITEGKNRQIHRMADACNLKVQKLHRVSFGGITYEGVRIGEVRKLSASEVRHLQRLAQIKPKERPKSRGSRPTAKKAKAKTTTTARKGPRSPNSKTRANKSRTASKPARVGKPRPNRSRKSSR